MVSILLNHASGGMFCASLRSDVTVVQSQGQHFNFGFAGAMH